MSRITWRAACGARPLDAGQRQVPRGQITNVLGSARPLLDDVLHPEDGASGPASEAVALRGSTQASASAWLMPNVADTMAES